MRAADGRPLRFYQNIYLKYVKNVWVLGDRWEEKVYNDLENILQ